MVSFQVQVTKQISALLIEIYKSNQTNKHKNVVITPTNFPCIESKLHMDHLYERAHTSCATLSSFSDWKVSKIGRGSSAQWQKLKASQFKPFGNQSKISLKRPSFQ